MIDRRTVLALLAAAASPARAGTEAAQPFERDTLDRMAAERAASPYRAPTPVPKAWRDLSYDQYRAIWFRHDRALWSDSNRPYRVDFFAPGLYFPHPVRIDVVENGRAMPVAFDLADFDRSDQFPDIVADADLGFSGFRLRTSLERPGIMQEFCVFQGASYFRAIGRGESYGLSARGLALSTGHPSGEEFPEFRRFWIEAPGPDDRSLTVHALLDSPSVAGAYTFVIDPGDATRITVDAALFPRVGLPRAGFAPLTSMFLFDGTNRDRFDDFRPAVHDSDGLMIWNGAGEVLWRPLANPRDLQISDFFDRDPRGFGLMQRSRELSDFADLEASYHTRPSLWITPRGDWGPGSVQLVEIPADREIYDNIVAYWQPEAEMAAGQRHDLSYEMLWGVEAEGTPGVAPVIRTRQGLDFDRKSRLVAIDFAPHAAFSGDLTHLTPFASANEGTLQSGPRLERNPGTGGVRLSFAFDPDGWAAREFRAQIVEAGRPVSEVWLYRWTP